MRELLDLKNQKKVAVLEKIFYSSNHTCTQSKLLEQLNMTYPTLLSVVDGINSDIVRFGYSGFSISRHSHSQSYSININKGISIQLLVHAYIRESSKFQLLELLLTSSFPNLQLLSKRLYISYNSLRKDIAELNQILKKRGIKISAKEGVRLEGDEIGIRLFYTFLYLNVYGGDSWPFSYIQYFEITRILENCPKEIYIAHSIDKSMLVHYYLAVHLLRVRQGFIIPESREFAIALYTPYPEESIESFNLFMNNLNVYVPNVTNKIQLFTSRILLSVFLAFGSYSSIDKVPPFFYLENQFNQNKFLETVFFITNQVDQHLSIPFSEREKEKLLYSLLSVTYRFFLFKGLSLELSSVIMGFSEIERNPKKIHKMKHLKYLVQQMMELEGLAILEPSKKELGDNYLLILEKRIDFSKHTLPIKVAILSVISNETATFDFMSHFSNYYNICVTDRMEKNIDLFISDFPLSPSVISRLSIHQPVVYVNTRWTETDYMKVNTILAEISAENFINK